MAKSESVEEISVRTISKKVYELSTVYNGYYRHRIYMGYKKADAIKRFQQTLKEGKV